MTYFAFTKEIANAGVIVNNYTFAAPIDADVVVTDTTASNIIIDPPTSLLNLTVTMPQKPVDGQTVQFGTTQSITTFTLNIFNWTPGYDTVTFTSPLVGDSDPTGLSPTTTTSGYQIVDVGGGHVGSDPTGLMGATTYTADITIDGVVYHLSILGSNADTFDHLINQINGSSAGPHGNVLLVGGNIKFTSESVGDISTVLIADTGGDPLFGTLTGYVAINSAVDGLGTTYTADITIDTIVYHILAPGDKNQTYTELLATINAVITPAGYDVIQVVSGHLTDATPTGLANDATVYTATITVDGFPFPISAVGSANQTYGDLLTTINTAIGVNGIATFGNPLINAGVGLGQILITSASVGNGNLSTITVVDTDPNHLFAALIGTIDSSVHGAVYGTATIDTGKVKITSGTTGVASDVTIVDVGTHFLFASLSNFSVIDTDVDGTTGGVDFRGPPPTSLNDGQGFKYIYRADNTTWYRQA